MAKSSKKRDPIPEHFKSIEEAEVRDRLLHFLNPHTVGELRNQLW